jgi:hypothetical protein
MKTVLLIGIGALAVVFLVFILQLILDYIERNDKGFKDFITKINNIYRRILKNKS